MSEDIIEVIEFIKESDPTFGICFLVDSHAIFFHIANTYYKEDNVMWFGDDDKNSTKVLYAYHEMSGTIRWDGCANFRTNEECMAHVCNYKQMVELTDMMKAVYNAAVSFLPRFDKGLAGMKEGFSGYKEIQRYTITFDELIDLTWGEKE